MTHPLATNLARALEVLHRAQHRSAKAKPGDEQRAADRELIQADRAYHNARRAFEQFQRNQEAAE